MTYRVETANLLDEIKKSSIWLRKKYNIPPEMNIKAEFEQEFNVQIQISCHIPDSIDFESEEHYTCFLLRWS